MPDRVGTGNDLPCRPHIAVCDDSNRDMALQGYEVSAVRYLAKPFPRPMLREALLYCCKMCCRKKEILLPTAKGQRRIPLSDILYAEAMRRVTRLALVDRTKEIALKFSDLFALLPISKPRLEELKSVSWITTSDGGAAAPLSCNSRCRIPFG